MVIHQHKDGNQNMDRIASSVGKSGCHQDEPMEEDSVSPRVIDNYSFAPLRQHSFDEEEEEEEGESKRNPLEGESIKSLPLLELEGEVLNRGIEDVKVATEAPPGSRKEDEVEDKNESPPSDQQDSSLDVFREGDHVYQWCSFAGIPGMFQHHGIVTKVWEPEGDDEEVRLTVVDFSFVLRGSSSNRCVENSMKSCFQHREGTVLRALEQESSKKWHKVEYEAPFWKRALYRTGTCTCAASHPPGLVLARVQFLLDHPETLPDYHVLYANCECVAVWCKTSMWCTLQGASMLGAAAMGQVKSTATVAAWASTQTVATTSTVPSAGLWGLMGYTTQVSVQAPLLSVQPYLLPAIGAYGLVSVGAPTLALMHSRHKWKQTTEQLHRAFWESALEHPDIIVELIAEYSRLE